MGRVSPVRASSPTTANEPGRSKATCPLPSKQPQRDRQVEAAGVFLQVGRGQVDHHPIDRPAIPRVDDRPLDPVRALPHGRLGQADQHRLGHRREGDVDLDFDRRGVDADQRVRGELREHSGSVSTPGATSIAGRDPSGRLGRRATEEKSTMS